MLLPLVALLAAAPTPPWGTGESRGEDLAVSLVTFGPGDDLISWWGHTAMVVEDTRLHQTRLYNYGMFGYSTGFIHKFVQGRLEFWVEDTPWVLETYQMYRTFGRDVTIQELELTPEKATLLAKLLADNVLPQNREYLYHHYNDNCSTRPRDLIDRAFDGALLKATSGPARMSLRLQTRRYTRVNVPMSLVLDYLQNNELDRPITQKEEAFLPEELEHQLDALTVEGHAAVKRKWSFYTAAAREPTPAAAPSWTLWLLITGCVLGAVTSNLLRSDSKVARVLFGLECAAMGLVLGSLGLFLFIVGHFTNHTVAHHNENLFLVNPVTFALLPLGVMRAWGSERAGRALLWVWSILAALAVVGVLTKVLPLHNQNNWNLIALFAPLSLEVAIALWLKRLGLLSGSGFGRKSTSPSVT